MSSKHVSPARPDTSAPSGAVPQTDVMALRRQLGELRDAGVVTNEEFEAKKTELLSRI